MLPVHAGHAPSSGGLAGCHLPPSRSASQIVEWHASEPAYGCAHLPLLAEYRGGSGWESDADLASGEQQLSQDASEQEEEQQHEGQEPQQLLDSSWASPAGSPRRGLVMQRQQPCEQQRAASDTLPISDSDAPGSGTVSDGNNGCRSGARPAGLTSASLSPAGAGEGGVITPPGEQLLAASDTPASGLLPSAGGAPVLAVQPPVGIAGSSHGGDSGSGSGSQHAAGPWQGLSVKAVVLKRPGHVASHQRLSPALVDEDAMQLVRRSSAQAPAAAAASAAADHVVPSSHLEHQPQQQ